MKRPPVGSDEWIEWVKNLPKTDRQIFCEKVEDSFTEKTGISYFMLTVTDKDGVKEETDFSRIVELVHDCFEDNSTVEETVDFIIEFAKAHGYMQ